MKPKIGVTGPDLGGWPAWAAIRLAIWRAGGRAVRITPSRSRTLDGLSGLIIGGGADVDSRLYNEECASPDERKMLRREMRQRWRRRQTWALMGFTPEAGFELSWRAQFYAFYKLSRYRVGLGVDIILLLSLRFIRQLMSVPWATAQAEHKSRDTLEIPLIREAIAKGLPVLGICRGMQLINVCLGGSLHQEIALFYEEAPLLTTLLPRKRVVITPTSLLRQIVRSSSLHVNSLHYQAVKKLGEGLVAVACEPNGVVQAIEHPDADFIVGVQWHPEYLALEKPSQQRIFRAFVSAAQVVMSSPKTAAIKAPIVPRSDLEALAQITRMSPNE